MAAIQGQCATTNLQSKGFLGHAGHLAPSRRVHVQQRGSLQVPGHLPACCCHTQCPPSLARLSAAMPHSVVARTQCQARSWHCDASLTDARRCAVYTLLLNFCLQVFNASSKALRDRINSVKNTQKITDAMKLVAAAKVRRAQDAVVNGRPFSENLVKVC